MPKSRVKMRRNKLGHFVGKKSAPKKSASRRRYRKSSGFSSTAKPKRRSTRGRRKNPRGVPGSGPVYRPRLAIRSGRRRIPKTTLERMQLAGYKVKSNRPKRRRSSGRRRNSPVRTVTRWRTRTKHVLANGPKRRRRRRSSGRRSNPPRHHRKRYYSRRRRNPETLMDFFSWETATISLGGFTGFTASLWLPKKLAEKTGYSQLSKGWGGFLATSVTALGAGWVAHKASPRLGAAVRTGGLIAAGMKLLAAISPALVKELHGAPHTAKDARAHASDLQKQESADKKKSSGNVIVDTATAAAGAVAQGGMGTMTTEDIIRNEQAALQTSSRLSGDGGQGDYVQMGDWVQDDSGAAPQPFVAVTERF